MEVFNITYKLLGLIKIKESSYLKKIYFCGVQVYKKYLTNYYTDQTYKINRIYMNFGFTTELQDILKNIFQISNTEDKYNNKIWLIYIHSLIEQNNEEDALTYIKKYIQLWGTDELHQNLTVAKFAEMHSISNEKIKKSVFIYDNLLNNIVDESLFKDKTIAIVGNSGCELNQNKGSEIDSHDIVIRFNNYPEDEKWAKDYGKKTDIWVRNLSVDLIQKDRLDQYAYIIQNDDLIYRKNTDRNLDLIYETYNNNKNYYILPIDFRRELKTKYGINRATSGCNILWTLYKLFGTLDKVDIYGFSFLSKNYKDTEHYYDTVSKLSKFHDMKIEIDFLHKLYYND